MQGGKNVFCKIEKEKYNDINKAYFHKVSGKKVKLSKNTKFQLSKRSIKKVDRPLMLVKEFLNQHVPFDTSFLSKNRSGLIDKRFRDMQ